jgi:hypothetical protein
MSSNNWLQIINLIKKSNDLGIKISYSKEKLVLHNPEGKLMDPSLLEDLKLSKNDLIKYLGTHQITKLSRPDFQISAIEKEGIGYYETMHQQKKEYMRYLIYGKFSYDMSLDISFKNLDKASLDRSIDTIFERHESLRTGYCQINGNIVQYICHTKPPGFKVEYVYLNKQGDIGEQFNKIQQELSTRLTDYAIGPFLIIKVVMAGDEDSVLHLRIGHIISDQRSLEILEKEIKVLYEAYKNGKDNPLPPLTVQYKEYAQWLNKLFKSEFSGNSRSFYEKRIINSLSKSNEKADYSFLQNSKIKVKGMHSYSERLEDEIKKLTNNKNSDEHAEAHGLLVNLLPDPGAGYTTYIQDPLFSEVKSFCRSNNFTIYNIVLSAFVVLQYIDRSERNVRIYSPMSTRIFEEFENIVGWLTSEIILCITLDENWCFYDLIHEVTEVFIETSNHRFYPHERLLCDLDIQLSILTPMFVDFIEKKDRTTSRFNSRHYSAIGHFNLKCIVFEFNNCFSVVCNYSSKAYPNNRIELLFEKYKKALASLISNPKDTLNIVIGDLIN